jgi:hypothetical protein
LAERARFMNATLFGRDQGITPANRNQAVPEVRVIG